MKIDEVIEKGIDVKRLSFYDGPEGERKKLKLPKDETGENDMQKVLRAFDEGKEAAVQKKTTNDSPYAAEVDFVGRMMDMSWLYGWWTESATISRSLPDSSILRLRKARDILKQPLFKNSPNPIIKEASAEVLDLVRKVLYPPERE
ncbi:MAG: hypothetical protein AB7T14_03990 [Candidatus Methylacidiphilaceae bacterium]